MDKKYSGKKIYFRTLEKATQGDEKAMREVLELFKPYMVSLSMDNGIFKRELYERLVRRLMLTVMKFRLDYEEK